MIVKLLTKDEVTELVVRLKRRFTLPFDPDVRRAIDALETMMVFCEASAEALREASSTLEAIEHTCDFCESGEQPN